MKKAVNEITSEHAQYSKDPLAIDVAIQLLGKKLPNIVELVSEEMANDTKEINIASKIDLKYIDGTNDIVDCEFIGPTINHSVASFNLLTDNIAVFGIVDNIIELRKQLSPEINEES